MRDPSRWQPAPQRQAFVEVSREVILTGDVFAVEPKRGISDVS